jgi:alkylation response protein AidB-like acyl-CoA dehydrogenase
VNELTNELDPVEQRRLLQAWLADHRSPTPRQLAEAGLVAPHWPRPWGLDADPHLQLAITEELAAANVAVPDSTIGMGWAGPTILAGGTEAQHRRWLPGILDGSEMWTQLFSEPNAGSDLASLRTSAVRDGDHYVVNGQKIWSTWANRSQWGILLARTDATVAKHQGISYFVVDMATPGVEVRKIIEMTGGNHFNETFLNEVRIPVENRIGAEGSGWRLATVTLGNERVALSEGGVLWGMGPTFGECMAEIRRGSVGGTPVTRQRAAKVYSDGFVTNLLTQKIVEAMLRGDDPSPVASIRKAKADANAQAILELICDLAGPAGMLGIQSEEAETNDPWHWAYLFSRALTIGGGTSEIQRNIIGERVLGLPREPRIQS